MIPGDKKIEPVEFDSETSETSRRIMQAALDVFLEKGYVKATTRAIAAAAGVNEVTLFRHFGNKLNLLTAVVDAFSMAPGLRDLLQNQLTGDYQRDLHILANYLLISGMNRKRGMTRLLMCEAQQAPEIRHIVMNTQVQTRSLLAEYFRKQVDNQATRDGLPPDVLAQSFFGIVISYGMTLHSFQEDEIVHETPSDVLVAQYVDIFYRGTARQV